jgi:carboxypeptidase Taq
MTSGNPLFDKLQALGKTTALYVSIQHVIAWDQETYMPPGAQQLRADQMELLAGVIHKQKTAPSFKKALSHLCNLETGELLETDLSPSQKAAVKLWYKNWKDDSKLPSSFIKQKAKVCSESLHAWNSAKEEKNFKLFEPLLKKTVELAQKQAKLLGYKEHPYDALLDEYEPGMTVATLTPLFTELKEGLTSLLKELKAKKNLVTVKIPDLDIEKQMKIGKDLLNAIGFSEEISRLDTSSHPFSMPIHPTDTRMTTRIFKDNLISHILSVLHESGHALYNTNLPLEYYGTPICEALSHGTDESQSRLWETLVGRNMPFWNFFYPKLQEAFPNELKNISVEDFYKSINKVEPSMIRVESDEVSYCLHVILRFEIEKALIEGSLKVKDIPRVWNQKMQESFGITPANDSEGCLQDIHWSIGAFGYFPTYALGNLLAAQLYEALKTSMPDIEKQIENGQFTSLRNWLKDNIHKHGKTYKPEELILKVTKKPLCFEAYIRYLRKKYLELYGVLP